MKLRRQSQGFTLIEILVALAILSVIALLASNAFDGARTKAQAMISLGKQVGDANIQLKTDTGCFVKKPSALFDPAAAQDATNNFCSRTFGNTWSRPYLGQYTVDTDGKLKAEKVSSQVLVSLPAPESATVGGITQKRYFVRFENVPMDVIKQALVECNTTDATAGDLTKDRCRASTLTGETASFDMLYATTR